MVRAHSWLVFLVALMLVLTGCDNSGTRAASTPPVKPTPATPAETKAQADVAKETVITTQLTKAGSIKTVTDADNQIAVLRAEIVAIHAEQAALVVQDNEHKAAIKVLTAEKTSLVEAHDAFVTHLVSGLCLLAAVVLGVFWWFAPAGLKDADGKAALIAAGTGAVLYVVAAYISWVIWAGIAILTGLGIYILNRNHLVGTAFATLIKDGQVVMADLKRAGWVQAVLDDVNKALIKLHIEHVVTPPANPVVQITATTTAPAAPVVSPSPVAIPPATP